MSMTVFFDEAHLKHAPKVEIHGGEPVEPFERPSRMEFILDELYLRRFSDIRRPDRFDPGPVELLHDADYLEFLRIAWDEWEEEGFKGDLIPTAFPARRLPATHIPDSIDGKAGWYAMATETSITPGTWEAAQASCASAQSALRHVVSGEAESAFALCRPPGHHAMKDMFGGYCFLNNAAVAAQMFRAEGAERVAVLDVDFHHGNGTQDIFYDRSDVLFVSLHGDPIHAFPYFSGHAGETGAGDGEGYNMNLPLRPAVKYDEWGEALETALGRIREFGADALVVSLGVDAFEFDPISFFLLETEDFVDCGGRISGLRLPTVIVMEGGYAIEEIGFNVVGFLEGFLGS